MTPRNNVLHLVASRNIGNPGQVRYYVRHVWWMGPGNGARDTVVAQGSFEVPIGSRDTAQVVMRALVDALAQLVEAQTK